MPSADKVPSREHELTEEQQIARRVRAAIAFSGLRSDEVIERIGGDDVLTLATLRRITSDTNPRGATLDELWRLADVCGVPRAWLESGWEDEPAAPRPTFLGRGKDQEERLAIVERYLEALLAQTELTMPSSLRVAAARQPPRPRTHKKHRHPRAKQNGADSS